MSFQVEDGNMIPDANALVSVEFVTSYLTSRGRQTENSWSSKPATSRQAAIVAATDYMEQRWNGRLKGRLMYEQFLSARGTFTLTANMAAGESVTIDTTTLTADTDFDIEPSIDGTLANLVAAINNDGTLGVEAVAVEGVGNTIILTWQTAGTSGNTVVTTTTASNGSWSNTTLLGGNDTNDPQPLMFPRRELYVNGIEQLGVPLKVKYAVAEYAVRALSESLLFDPEIDSSGRAVTSKREKVGPIEEETQYTAGAGFQVKFKPYSAADRFMTDFLKASGGGLVRA